MMLCGLPLALLFIAFTSPTIAQKRGASDAGGVAERTQVVEVAEGAPLSVECVLRVEQRAEWRVQRGGAGGGWEMPAEDLRAGGERALAAGGLVRARLTAPHARPLHAGLYRCHPAAAPVRLRLLPASASASASATAAAAAAAAAAADADAAAPGLPDDQARTLQYYDLFQTLRLNCSSPVALRADVQYQWRKNGSEVQLGEEGRSAGAVLEEGGAVLVYRRATEEEYGNYTCSIGDRVLLAWDVRAHTIARLPPNSNVVEGQKLSLVCKLHGRPAPRIEWRYSKPGAAAEAENATGDLIDTQSEGARFSAKDSPAGVPGGVLELAVAQPEDAGVYYCAAAGGSRGMTVLRVKDVYAALWPFLGICLEVFILCAIILVYEKRRTKPEMEDSDADNHDQ